MAKDKTHSVNNPEAAEPSKTGRGHMIPVWFFAGLLLLAYGILILITGIREWAHPPATILANLHPTFWWSLLLIALGAIFTFSSYPKKRK